MKRLLFVFILLAILSSASGVLPVKAQTSFDDLIKILGEPKYETREGLCTAMFANTGDIRTVTGWSIEELRAVGYWVTAGNQHQFIVDKSRCVSGGGGSGGSLIPEPTPEHSMFMIIMAWLLGILVVGGGLKLIGVI